MDLRALGTEREEQEGSPGLQEERGWEGAWFPLGDSRERQELRTSQVVGSCQYIGGHFPNCHELRELGQHCLGAASSMKEYSREEEMATASGPGQTRGIAGYWLRDHEV